MPTLRQTLDEKLSLLSTSQLAFFNKLYPNKDELKTSHIKTAIGQCERTIKTNLNNKEKLNSLIQTYPQNIEEAELNLGKVSSHTIIDNTLLKAYSDILTKVEVVIPEKILITKGHAKTPEHLKLKSPYFEFRSFSSEDVARSYYKDNGEELFEVGVGMYQDESCDFCYIDDVFFKVNLKAEVWGAKQGRGDKLYHVEKITSIEFSKAEEKLLIDLRKTQLEKEIQNLIKQIEYKNKEHLILDKFYE